MTSDKSYATEGRLAALIEQAGPTPQTTGIGDVTTTGVKSLGFLTVPAGTIQGGEKYSGDAHGVWHSATTPTSIDWYVYWGGTSGTQVADLSIPAAGLWSPGSSDTGWGVDFTVRWVSATELAVKLNVDWKTAGTVAGSTRWFVTKDTTGLSNATDMNLTLGFAFGGGMTLHTYGVHIWRAT